MGHPSTLRRLWRYVWAAPTTLLGLLLIPLAGRGGVRRRDGLLEASGGLLGRLLAHATFLSGGVAAVTLGHVVLGRTAGCLDRTRAHEREHVRQCERWGPLFVPAYLAAGLWTWIRGGHPYWDNRFERLAREAEAAPPVAPDRA